MEAVYTEQLHGLRTNLANKINALGEIGIDDDKLNTFLEADNLDDQLAQFVMLMEATPQGLANFEDHELIERLLSHTNLLKQMLLADGPQSKKIGSNKFGPPQYGHAMKIYTDILKATDKDISVERDGFLFRLALATSLEHAVPIQQNNPIEPHGDAKQFIDPVKRYLHYEEAYLAGELDPAVNALTVWDLRFVVNGDEPDSVLAWGRSMLRNFRPDHILNVGYNWRYVNIVRSNIPHGSQNVKYDRPELQKYQNILMNGGVCGRRAFFGRFILRAFGIPTTARPSKGHGALCHWTPAQNIGWVVNLGPDWGRGYMHLRKYHSDQDFRATSIARIYDTNAYWKVKRAQWMGDVLGEHRVYGENQEKDPIKIGFWYGVSLKMQRAIIKAGVQAPPPLHLNAANNLIAKMKATPTKQDAKEIKYHDSGEIVIPAAAIINPGKAKDVHVMTSFDNALQIYLPSFMPQGLTIMRGGMYKSDTCTSGHRMKSGGYGKYDDWGFRVAMTLPEKGNIDNGDIIDEHAPSDLFVLNLSNDEDGDQNECITMEFVYIKPGSFVMGGENNKDDRFWCIELPKHEVVISRGFYIGKYPVTRAQYQAVMKMNPEMSNKQPNCPVGNIGEVDALAFCSKLSENTDHYDIRLPTEAEWEYACRGGRGNEYGEYSKWFFGDKNGDMLGEYAWFKNNSGGKSHPVGQKKPNPFGLYDIYGNVCERVADKYDNKYYASSPNKPMVDPTGPSQGTKSIFTYKLQGVTQAGKYALTAQVVTVNYKQRLNVAVNSNDKSRQTQQVMEFPFTLGQWQQSEPVTILLSKGENTIRFWRDNPPQHGLAIKQFTLKPVDDIGGTAGEKRGTTYCTTVAASEKDTYKDTDKNKASPVWTISAEEQGKIDVTTMEKEEIGVAVTVEQTSSKHNNDKIMSCEFGRTRSISHPGVNEHVHLTPPTEIISASSAAMHKTMKFKVEIDPGLFHRFKVTFSSVTELFQGFRKNTIAMVGNDTLFAYKYSYKDNETGKINHLDSEVDFTKLQEYYKKLSIGVVHVRKSYQDNNNYTNKTKDAMNTTAKGAISTIKSLLSFGPKKKMLSGDVCVDGSRNRAEGGCIRRSDKLILPTDLIKLLSENQKCCLDIGFGNAAADTDTSTTRLVFGRLDGPSVGYISTDHILGVFSQDRCYRLDIGKDAFRSEQSASHDSWATCLYIRRIIMDDDNGDEHNHNERRAENCDNNESNNSSQFVDNNKTNNEPLKYGELVGIFASEGAYSRLDIGSKSLKKMVPSDHNSWATRLFIQKKQQ